VTAAQVQAANIATSAATGALSGQIQNLVKDFEDFKPEDLSEDDIAKIQAGDFSHLSKKMSPTQQVMLQQFIKQQQSMGVMPRGGGQDFEGDDKMGLLSKC